MKDNYMKGLKKIGIILGQKNIRFARESDQLAKKGITKKKYREMALANLERFKAYWKDSEPFIQDFLERNPAHSETEWDRFCEEQLRPLESYRQLQDIGWKGYIHPKMREFYRARHGGKPNTDIDNEVCKYFSTTLLKHQLKLFSGSDRRLQPIKVSFVATPPGAPKAIRDSPRVDLRILPRDVAASHMPSWTCKGVLVAANGKARPCLRSWRELQGKENKIQKGRLVISNGAQRVVVKADILRDS